MKYQPLFLLLFALFLLPLPVSADIVYPARLEMKESEPGLFDVTFNLPLINGKRLKAKLVFPAVCEAVAEPQIQATIAGYAERHQLRCDSEALYGEHIAISGLLGTQTDVLFSLETLDGRRYTTTLKPAKAVFTIPFPPSFLELGRGALLDGMRRVLRRPELWLVLFVALFLGLSGKSLEAGIMTYAIAYAVSQTLVKQNWLLLFPALPPLITALTAFMPSLDMVKGERKVRGWMSPFWLSMLFLGLLYGGASSEVLSPDGLSHYEQRVALAVFTLGTGIGLCLILLCISELRQLRDSLFKIKEKRVTLMAGYIGGIAACGLFLYYLSIFLFIRPEVFTFLVTPSLFAVLLGTQIPLATPGNPRWMLLVFSGLFSVGLVFGFRGPPFPLTTFVVFGSLFLFGFMSLVQRAMPPSVVFPTTVLALVYHGWYLGNSIGENMSLPLPNTLGAGILVTFVFYGSLSLFERKDSDVLSRGFQILGGAIVLMAIASRLLEYRTWFETQIIPELAMGILPLPILTVVLFLVLFFIWPQKPQFVSQTARPVSSPIFHWIVLGMIFFLLPYGTLRVHNPFFEPRPPSAENAHKIATVLLTNTYKAFNLEEEEVVYDRLAENVTGDLIADIYLDSRRRLEAGTLQGAKVTVKNVRVLSLNDTTPGRMSEAGFAYECRWSVTANVRHWKHTHNRQNVYDGILTLKIIDRTWKIAHIELLDEERIVISGNL